MPDVCRMGQYYTTQYVTGPQYLVLWLDLQPERIDDPFVTAPKEAGLYPLPDEVTVRRAALAGTDKANEEFGTAWHPFEIKYCYDGYDYARCGLITLAAYNIVKELAERGPDSIPVIRG